jgi:hypothetical protein
MDFTIKRSLWLRGEGSTKSRLLRESDGKMCCLGQYALACGLSRSQIEGCEAPISLITHSRMKPQKAEDWADAYEIADWMKLYQRNGPGFDTAMRTHDLMSANDYDELGFTEAERETSIIGYFAKIGVNVTFVD